MNEIRITVDDKNVQDILERSKQIGDNAANTVNLHCEKMAMSCRLQFIANGLNRTTIEHRSRTANRMYAKRMGKNSSAVIIPESSYQLDTMRPQFKSLDYGSSMYKWAMKYFRTFTLNSPSPSRWHYDKKGRIHGKLWVTPDPWMEKAQARVRPQLVPNLISSVRETLGIG